MPCIEHIHSYGQNMVGGKVDGFLLEFRELSQVDVGALELRNAEHAGDEGLPASVVAKDGRNVPATKGPIFTRQIPGSQAEMSQRYDNCGLFVVQMTRSESGGCVRRYKYVSVCKSGRGTRRVQTWMVFIAPGGCRGMEPARSPRQTLQVAQAHSGFPESSLTNPHCEG